MLAITQSDLLQRLTSTFGKGADWKSKTGASCELWANLPFELIVCRDGGNDVHIRRTLEDRRHLRTVPVVVLADSDYADQIRVVGPREPYIVRQLNSVAVLNLIEQARSLSTPQAARFLERELRRLEESVLPGIRVKELLTPHYIRTRIRQRPSNRERLEAATTNVKRISASNTWRSVFDRLGYQIERLQPRGYLLRHQNSPVAVLHPMNSAEEFSRMNENGELPDGLVLNDCETYGAHWGILAADLRFRIFQANPSFGSATARYIEIDARELESQDRLYLGLLAPEALKANGTLTEWASDARDFGEELRKGLEDRLRSIALPNLATGIGRHLEISKGIDLKDRDKLREIEEAVLTLVFRFMFLLHVEARGYLPVQSHAYAPHSARGIAEDCKKEKWEYDSRSSHLWDRLIALTKMIRSGNRAVGVPAYNGSLFAADWFPGAELLEKIEIPDTFIAPAIRAIAFDPDQSDAGLDYAGLQVGHLGAIYEALLALKLTRASEDLKYDAKRDVFRPMRAGEKAEITASELFYQTEKGGRKAGGVYYTREEFVQHLLKNSLIPALDEHLERIKKLAKSDPTKAANDLFNFSIVDPAMGSGHFLTTALDMMADRIEIFLAEIGGLPAIRNQLAELRKGQDSNLASVEDVDLLRRLILKRCIYGVDISPMAVEVANVTLWLASFVPGLALSYLGSNLKCGDALIGVAGQDVVDTSQVPLFAERAKKAMERAVKLHAKLVTIPDVTPDEVHQSQELDDELRVSTAGLRRVFDLWTAEPLGLSKARETLELHAEQIVTGDYAQSARLQEAVSLATPISANYRFFHWQLEFPHVFHGRAPGFDVVVGNPPWDKIKFEKPSFLALRDPGYRGVKLGTERDQRELRLLADHPEYRIDMEKEILSVSERRRFFKPDNGYSIQGAGDTDLSKLFCERYVHLTTNYGTLGVVLPRNTFINQGSQSFRQWLFANCDVRRIDSLLNSGRWAFNMEPRYAVSLLTARVNQASSSTTVVVSGPISQLDDFLEIKSGGDIRLELNALGHSRVIPSVKTRTHADLLNKLRAGTRFDEIHLVRYSGLRTSDAVPTRPVPYTELHESAQRRMWNLDVGMGDTPVWKGRSFNQYDPHGNDPAGVGIWDELYDFIIRDVKRSNTFKHFKDWGQDDLARDIGVNNARMAFRDVTNSTNSRTVIACLIPPRIPLTHTAPYLTCRHWSKSSVASALGVLNSLPFDWTARRYVGSHLSYFILNMLTFPSPENTPWQQIGKLAARLSCVDDRFAEFAAEAGVDYGLQTDAERDHMRAEIDALVAHAYDLKEDELRFVFTDFTERAVTPAYRQLVLEKFERL